LLFCRYLRKSHVALLIAVFIAVGCSDGSDSSGSTSPQQAEPQQGLPPQNPYLPQEVIAPLPNPASVNNDAVEGPRGPSRALSESEIQYVEVGPGHYLANISSPYENGEHVIWTKGTDRINKLDYDTLEILASFPLPGQRIWTATEFFTAYNDILDAPPGDQGLKILTLGAQTQTLVGAYPLLDRDNVLYVGYQRQVIAYTDSIPGDPSSEIVIARSWTLPAEILGNTIGMNLTYDGRLVFATEEGFVVVLDRDFSAYHVVLLPHAEEAVSSPNAWVRNSVSVDENGGVYLVSNGYLHKVIWNAEFETLSLDPDEGAWSEPYRNGLGTGSGSSPALVGFGPQDDRLVAITDGDELMNLTLYWRDSIPEGWQALAGAPSSRIAGYAPANFGDPTVTSTQNEQQVLVYGYTMMIGQNDPASIPEGLPYAARVLAVGFIADDPAVTPQGAQALRWNKSASTLDFAWGNLEVSAGSCIPRGASKSNLAYWIGIQNGGWALQGVDVTSGEMIFYQELPKGVKYNNLFSGVLFDNEGYVMYGTSFGFARLPKELAYLPLGKRSL
jgi:hypothetical protein